MAYLVEIMVLPGGNIGLLCKNIGLPCRTIGLPCENIIDLPGRNINLPRWKY